MPKTRRKRKKGMIIMIFVNLSSSFVLSPPPPRGLFLLPSAHDARNIGNHQKLQKKNTSRKGDMDVGSAAPELACYIKNSHPTPRLLQRPRRRPRRPRVPPLRDLEDAQERLLLRAVGEAFAAHDDRHGRRHPVWGRVWVRDGHAADCEDRGLNVTLFF